MKKVFSKFQRKDSADFQNKLRAKVRHKIMHDNWTHLHHIKQKANKEIKTFNKQKRLKKKIKIRVQYSWEGESQDRSSTHGRKVIEVNEIKGRWKGHIEALYKLGYGIIE